LDTVAGSTWRIFLAKGFVQGRDGPKHDECTPSENLKKCLHMYDPEA